MAHPAQYHQSRMLVLPAIKSDFKAVTIASKVNDGSQQ
jgi:hypothetical protein